MACKQEVKTFSIKSTINLLIIKQPMILSVIVKFTMTLTRIRSEKSSGNKMDDNDIFNGESSALIELCLTHDGQDVFWSRVKKRLGRTGSEKSVMDDVSALGLHFRQQLTENRDTALPLVAYYPVNRSVTEAKLEPKSKRYDQLDAFSNAFTKTSSFINFFEWFRNREDLENEQSLKLKDFDYQDH